jgi:hypothetical protein
VDPLLRAIFYPVTDGDPQRKYRARLCKPPIGVSDGNCYVQHGANILIVSKERIRIENVEKRSAMKNSFT